MENSAGFEFSIRNLFLLFDVRFIVRNHSKHQEAFSGGIRSRQEKTCSRAAQARHAER